MNREAEQHLSRAVDYVAKGEEFYRKAAEEIVAAQEADPTLTQREVADKIGKDGAYVNRLLQAVARAKQGDPFKVEWQSGSNERGTVTRKMLRDTPEIVAALEPAEQRKLATVLDTEAAKRQRERERASKQKEREHLGDDTVDALELREELQSTEYLLIKARGNLRGFVKHVGELGIETTPENWRASCLDWINDLEGHLGMAKALLAGDDIDWTAFDELLAKEGS